MTLQPRSLEQYQGKLNTLSDRGAMGLPDHYVRLRHEQGEEVYASLHRLTPTELCNICENTTRSLAERVAAGNLLALLGDPRVNTLSPQMIEIAGATITLGTDPDEVRTIVERYKETGIIAEWIEKESPTFSVTLSSYSISKYLMTNFDYLHYLQDCPNGEIPTTWTFGRYPSEKANHPVYTLSAEAADAYCRWLSKKTRRAFRLPTEYEWEYAAAGPERREFPWGEEFHDDYANTLESGLLTSTPVGIFPKGYSPFGLADMAGNVEEYVADDYHAYPHGEDVRDDLVESLGTYRIARGGSFTRQRDLARCRRRHGRYPSDIYVMGFRLAEDLPEKR